MNFFPEQKSLFFYHTFPAPGIAGERAIQHKDKCSMENLVFLEE